jgi:hypothetical protein
LGLVISIIIFITKFKGNSKLQSHYSSNLRQDGKGNSGAGLWCHFGEGSGSCVSVRATQPHLKQEEKALQGDL